MAARDRGARAWPWRARSGPSGPAGLAEPPPPPPPLPALPARDEDVTLSVVVPAREAAATLAAAVQRVLDQDLAPAEVVIAVGPSNDATRSVADDLAKGSGGRIRVVDNPSGRTPDGLNAAIAATTGQVVARVDAHSLLPEGYLRAAVETLRASGAANVGAVQQPVAEHGFARSVAAAMRSPLGTGGAGYRGAGVPGPVDTAYLGVFRREALDEVGGYDPVLQRNQDAELNLRLARAGYGVWLDPRLVVAYRPRASLGALARQYHQYGRWRRHTARLHRGSVALRQLVPPAVVVTLAGSAVASLVLRDGRYLGAAGAGYLGTLVGASAGTGGDLRQRAGTGLALATMHLSWGVGFLIGPPREVTVGTVRRDRGVARRPRP